MTFGKRQRFQRAHLLGAVDRDRDDRDAGLEREPADAGLRLAELAGARAPALRVHQQQPPRSRIV